MQKTLFSKSLFLGLFLTLAAQQTVLTANPPSLMQKADSFTGQALRGISTGVALGGLAVGTYQFAKAMALWAAAQSAETEIQGDLLKDKRNESLKYSLAALCTSGLAYALPRVNMTAFVAHIDLGVVFAAILNALSKR